MELVYGGNTASSMQMYADTFNMGGLDIWQEMLPGKDGGNINELVLTQYDIVDGRWPSAYNEVVLVVDKNNEVSDLVLCMLGFKSEEEMKSIIDAAMKGATIESKNESWEYSDILNTTFKLVLPTDCYRYNEADGTYSDMSENDTYMSYVLKSSEDIKIVGIIRPNKEAVAASITGSIGYTYALTEHIAEKINESEIVKAQKADPATDVITGLPFKTGEEEELSVGEKAAIVKEYIKNLSTDKKADLYRETATVIPEETLEASLNGALAAYPGRAAMEDVIVKAYAAEMGVSEETVRGYLASMSDEEIRTALSSAIEEQIRASYAERVGAELASLTNAQLAGALDAYIITAKDVQLASVYDNNLPPTVSESTYEENIKTLGVFDIDDPSSINIYASSFEAKDEIAVLIDEYNAGVSEDDRITYTDYIKLIMSSITTIINAISYILIAFVSISLVVSSIMIGIITYISVLERTKEIGILRAIGASKKDIGRVFNAETLLVGFASGMFGIGITLLLTIPINIIIKALTDIGGLAALPFAGAVILVLISMALTLVAGLIPSKIAAKKDPVEALRSE